MSDDLDLRDIDARYEPSPQFRAALRDRVTAIIDGADPNVMTDTRDLVVMDLEPAGTPSTPGRDRRMVAQIVLAAAAAAVVVVIALVVTRDDETTPADQPSPTVTDPVTELSTEPSQALLDASVDEELEPGTYFVDGIANPSTARIFVTVGAAWSYQWDERLTDDRTSVNLNLWRPGLVFRSPGHMGSMWLDQPGAVFADACHQSAGHLPTTSTLDGFVAQVRSQPGWAEVTVPSDITVDGFAGQAFQRTAPTDMSDCDIEESLRTRTLDSGGPAFRSWDGYSGLYYEPGQTETLWVLDIDGTIVVISASALPGESAADEFAAVFDSIRIAPRNDETTPAAQPLPTVRPAVSLSVPARPMPNESGEAVPLEAGTYFVDEVEGTPTPRIYATFDSGWYDLDRRPGWTHITKGYPPDAIGDVTFSKPSAVYADSCQPTEGFHPGPVTTVDGIITALLEQRGGWVDVTAPTGISIDGYVGKAFQRTAPADMTGCTDRNGGTEDPLFLDWKTADGPDGRPHEPGQTQTLWVLDLDGTVVVVRTELWPTESAPANADFADAMLDSIRIEQS